jgi:hypothetical protein
MGGAEISVNTLWTFHTGVGAAAALASLSFNKSGILPLCEEDSSL